ncbi:hypothetical protein [Streptomyces sp. 8N616]|uniref:hypothetical protein n=1 Tax=Streptomyces sp. 8N616 TaxID=3457414 RepID=UPI003FD6A6B2
MSTAVRLGVYAAALAAAFLVAFGVGWLIGPIGGDGGTGGHEMRVDEHADHRSMGLGARASVLTGEDAQ